MVEVEVEIECPHCNERITTMVEIEPMDWNDID